MNKNQQAVGIYRLYKLGRLAGTNEFDPEIKKLEMDLHPVHHEYAEKINEKSAVNGVLYVLDDAATDLYWDGKPYNTAGAKAPKAAKTEGKDAKKVDAKKADNTSDAKEKAKAAAANVKPEEKDAKLAELKAEYLKLTGNEAPPIWGIKKLSEQIEIESKK